MTTNKSSKTRRRPPPPPPPPPSRPYSADALGRSAPLEPRDRDRPPEPSPAPDPASDDPIVWDSATHALPFAWTTQTDTVCGWHRARTGTGVLLSVAQNPSATARTGPTGQSWAKDEWCCRLDGRAGKVCGSVQSGEYLEGGGVGWGGGGMSHSDDRGGARQRGAPPRTHQVARSPPRPSPPSLPSRCPPSFAPPPPLPPPPLRRPPPPPLLCPPPPPLLCPPPPPPRPPPRLCPHAPPGAPRAPPPQSRAARARRHSLQLHRLRSTPRERMPHWCARVRVGQGRGGCPAAWAGSRPWSAW